jgi:hypothetical protein
MVVASLIATKFLSAAGASSLRLLRRVPAQHLVSILVVSADVLDGNKAMPVAAEQPVRHLILRIQRLLQDAQGCRK